MGGDTQVPGASSRSFQGTQRYQLEGKSDVHMDSLPCFCSEVTTDITAIGCPSTSTVGPNHAGGEAAGVTSRPSWLVTTISVWKMTALSNDRGKSLCPAQASGSLNLKPSNEFFCNKLLLHSEHPHPFTCYLLPKYWMLSPAPCTRSRKQVQSIFPPLLRRYTV